MNSGQKTAVSLLVTIVLFAAFVFTAFAGVFSKIETKFYTPSRIRHERTEIHNAQDFCNEYIASLLSKIQSDFLADDSIQSYLSQNPLESDVIRRVQVTGKLSSDLPCIREIRLLDKNGRNIHFSTKNSDILRQTGTSKIYKNYQDILNGSDELSFDKVTGDENDLYRITFNQKQQFINASFPLKDKYNVCRGFFVFYISTSEIEKELIKNNLISVGDSLVLLANEEGAQGGFIINMPRAARNIFNDSILNSWMTESTGPDKIVAENDKDFFVLLSDFSSDYIDFGRIYDNAYFELPKETQILLGVSVFITLFLFLFLILSLKRDEMVVIRSRVKKLQFAMINEYLENKDEVDWEKVSRQIEYRKNDLFEDIRKSLGHKGKKHEKELNLLLENSWNEILAAVGTKQSQQKVIGAGDTAEIKKLLENAISTGGIRVETKTEKVEKTTIKDIGGGTFEAHKTPVLEELSDAEPLEEVEALSDAEPLEDVEELSDAEPLEEVEELTDAEPLEEVEELTDAEPLEDVEELSDAEPLEEVEELSDAEPLVEAEELTDAEPLEEVEELTDAEPLEDVEELSDAEPLEEVEELSDAEPLEEVEELSDAEPLEEVEELTDAEPLEEVEELEEITEKNNEKTLKSVTNSAEENRTFSDEAVPLEHFVENLEPIEEKSDFENIPKVAVDNTTFAPLKDNSFATVETVFAEELQFGIPYTQVVDADHREEEVEENMEFDLLDPDFGEDEELLPVEDENNYSMTSFAQNNVEVTELTGENENTIVEIDGVYSIAENLTLPKIDIDKDFMKLVDSVLR